MTKARMSITKRLSILLFPVPVGPLASQEQSNRYASSKFAGGVLIVVHLARRRKANSYLFAFRIAISPFTVHSQRSMILKSPQKSKTMGWVRLHGHAVKRGLADTWHLVRSSAGLWAAIISAFASFVYNVSQSYDLLNKAVTGLFFALIGWIALIFLAFVSNLVLAPWRLHHEREREHERQRKESRQENQRLDDQLEQSQRDLLDCRTPHLELVYGQGGQYRQEVDAHLPLGPVHGFDAETGAPTRELIPVHEILYRVQVVRMESINP